MNSYRCSPAITPPFLLISCLPCVPMACMLSPAATLSRQHHHNFICFSPPKPTSPYHLHYRSNHWNRALRCNAILSDIADDFLKGTSHLEQTLSIIPGFESGYLQFQRATEELPEVQKWGIVIVAGFTWIYLTARPGVLIGAIDTYILAPLQIGLDSLTGRRSLKRSDFLVGDRVGEGSFGVVYSGVIVPKNVSLEERVRKRGNKKAIETDERFKERVILKKVKLGVEGAIECGDFEDWFNYRLSRAAPETCAEYLGSFVADKTNSQFIKGEKWLVWKFEVLLLHGLLNYFAASYAYF